jgi:serpin B
MNTDKILSVLFSSLIIILLNAFSIDAESKDKSLISNVVEGNTTFALDLYRQVKNKEGNLFFSPYSISTALVMTYAGARGETEKQMMKTMQVPFSQERLHSGFSQLQESLNKVREKGKIEILIANSLWPHADYSFKKEYLLLLEKYYKASITALDYANHTEEARQTINQWVEDKTKDRIKDLIKPGFLNALTRLVLANGIYFKGNWESQFKKEHTRNMPFHVTPSRTVGCPMMFQEGKFGYYANAELQALEMPYEGDEISMLVLLPMNQEGLAQLEQSLTDSKLNRWINELREIRLQIFFPKFKTVSEFNLGEKLKSLGMINAFNPNKADFSGMDGTRNLHVSAVVHKAFVEIDEKGTEAAAATAIGIRTTSMAPQFKADHPFLFIIRDRITGTILFVGRVIDPTVAVK